MFLAWSVKVWQQISICEVVHWQVTIEKEKKGWQSINRAVNKEPRLIIPSLHQTRHSMYTTFILQHTTISYQQQLWKEQPATRHHISRLKPSMINLSLSLSNPSSYFIFYSVHIFLLFLFAFSYAQPPGNLTFNLLTIIENQ